MSLGRRRLAAYALPAIALPALGGACTSPEPVLYTIAVRPGPTFPAGPKIVLLRDIGLASYLDRKEVVRSSEDYKLGVMSNDWWGESLGSLLGRVLVVELSQRLPNSSIYPEGGAISADPNAVLGVNIQRLDLDASGSLELQAQAAVDFNRPRRSVSRSFRIVKPPPTPTVAGQVAATSDAVAELTDGLASLLQS